MTGVRIDHRVMAGAILAADTGHSGDTTIQAERARLEEI
ncbi:hypothetical protein SAMN04489716_2487 [Actinoplanes derwentensis]|uniref:Uncharacterized protein n=1 Tax=Actinoplanes derwentensis TaxID=113562 RepID=A0A1H1XJS5_9ACTN|nr:hypothetical protein SAMN04489716_2487 [Actinoplanes derwentensis]